MKAIINGKICTVTGPVYENGTVLYHDGKIVAVGENIEIPDGTEVFDAKGGYVTPGLIDVHSHISAYTSVRTMPGTMDVNEATDPITPEVRIIDAINPADMCIPVIRNAGFTSLYVLPGSANLIGGHGAAVKLRGHTIDEMVIPGTEMMKFALGENPKRVYGSKRMPATRMGNAALMRKTLFDAKVYSDALAKYEAGEGEMPKYDFKLDALVPVIRGEMKCRIHAHRNDDIMTAVRIAQEFGLDFCVEHCTEGWRVKDALAEAGVTCVVGPTMMGPLKEEMWGERLDTAKQLVEAGVNVCLTADMGLDTCWLPLKIGVLIREGLDPEYALKAVTINPAKVMGLEDRIGSLEAGKDADIAVFDGFPFSNLSKCVLTVIDGVNYCD